MSQNETPEQKYERRVKEFDAAWEACDAANFSAETQAKVREAYGNKLKAHAELRESRKTDIVARTES